MISILDVISAYNLSDSRYLIKRSLPHRISFWWASLRTLRRSLAGVDQVLSRPALPGESRGDSLIINGCSARKFPAN